VVVLGDRVGPAQKFPAARGPRADAAVPVGAEALRRAPLPGLLHSADHLDGESFGCCEDCRNHIRLAIEERCRREGTLAGPAEPERDEQGRVIDGHLGRAAVGAFAELLAELEGLGSARVAHAEPAGGRVTQQAIETAKSCISTGICRGDRRRVARRAVRPPGRALLRQPLSPLRRALRRKLQADQRQ
jgi:hypothetical protein